MSGSFKTRRKMEKIETVKNKRGANLAIGEVLPNTYNDYSGCTMDVEIIVYSDDFKRSFSFWLENIDTGYSGESWMDGYCDEELEDNPDFKDDWGLGRIYTEEELEERALSDSIDCYFECYPLAENPIFDLPILKYINRIEDAMELACCPVDEGGYRHPYTEKNADIARIFEWTEEEKFRSIRKTDLIDFEDMSSDPDIEVDCYHGDERDYYDLIQDLTRRSAVKSSRKEEVLQQDKLEEAVAYCSDHDTRMLLLPLVVCRGLQDTHFIHRVGLWNKMVKIVNQTDWKTDDAVNSLLLMRTVLLDELKRSRYVDFGYSYFDKYDLRRNNQLADESMVETDRLFALLEKLCGCAPVTMENPFGEEYCIDDYDDYDPLMKELRDKYDLVLPRHVALHFLLDDDALEEMAGKDLYNYTSDDNGEDYSEGLLSHIYNEMYTLVVPYRSMDLMFTGWMAGGKRPCIEGAYKASDVFAEFKIDRDSLPVFWDSDDEIEVVEEEVPQKEMKSREEDEPKFAATVEENGDISFGGLFKMIRVEGGTFRMGASGKSREGAHEDEFPIHEVTLGDYYIGQTPVTVELWLKVMGGSSKAQNWQIPIGGVNWFDCHKFVRKLNHLTKGKYYFSLPTEAQWEFAARGGLKSEDHKFSGSDVLDEVAWHSGNSDGKKHPVASLRPNELGIYDMSGNVGEWCEDEWDAYPDGPQTDPEPDAEGAFKVIRGGSYCSVPVTCRVSNRGVCGTPSDRYSNSGFRLAMTISKYYLKHKDGEDS